MIPVANPRASYIEHKEEIDEAILRVLDSGSYILGEEVKKFEDSFARYIGVKYAISVASGTDALHLGMRALGIGVGDEVITVSHTAVATVSAIVMTGATPVLVDIEPKHFTMAPNKIKEAITNKTKAILPVHIYGNPCEMLPIYVLAKKNKLLVIEDCAQATGASYFGNKVGSIGDIGCFSFYPTKNLGCFGDGGMVTTNSKKVAHKLHHLREYGWEKRYVSKIHGFNSRLDEIQAAVLNVKLKYLDSDNLRRKQLSGDESISSVHHLDVIRVDKRDKVRKKLLDAGIHTAIHYPVPIHKQPGYKNLVRVSGKLTETDKAAKEVLSLPMYPQLSWM